MNDDILQKQVLSITIEFRVSDTVQEFKMFNKSLFLHLPCVINHMEALWEFISVSITNAHSKSLINDCCLLNLTVNQLRQAAQKLATYRPLCGLVSMGISLSEPGIKRPNLSTDRIFSVFAQLGTEANTGKFPSNPSSSFWGDAITRKIKDGRRRPCLSTDWNSFSYLHN